MNISIHPQKQWVIYLGVTIPEVLNYENRQLEINLKYFHRDKCKEYEEKEVVNFNDYDSFIVYISETDELKNEIKNICKSINGISEELKNDKNLLQMIATTEKEEKTEVNKNGQAQNAHT